VKFFTASSSPKWFPASPESERPTPGHPLWRRSVLGSKIVSFCDGILCLLVVTVLQSRLRHWLKGNESTSYKKMQEAKNGGVEFSNMFRWD
jgi:hypothetical protein